MNIDKHWLQIPSNKIANAVVVTFFTICPGVIAVFVLNRNLFISLDAIKLVLLCTAISGSVWAFNYTLIDVVELIDIEKHFEKDQIRYLQIIIPSLFSAILTSIVLDIPSLFHYFQLTTTKLQFFSIAMLIDVISLYIINKTTKVVKKRRHDAQKLAQKAPE